MKLEPIDTNQLEDFKQMMKNSTISKIKEDVKSNRHNLMIAKNRISDNYTTL